MCCRSNVSQSAGILTLLLSCAWPLKLTILPSYNSGTCVQLLHRSNFSKATRGRQLSSSVGLLYVHSSLYAVVLMTCNCGGIQLLQRQTLDSVSSQLLSSFMLKTESTVSERGQSTFDITESQCLIGRL